MNSVTNPLNMISIALSFIHWLNQKYFFELDKRISAKWSKYISLTEIFHLQIMDRYNTKTAGSPEYQITVIPQYLMLEQQCT